MMMTVVGTYLYTLRKKNDYTLKQVGDAAGVSDRMVSAWEKGEHQPTLEPIVLAVEFLHGAWDDIVLLIQGEKTAHQAKELALYRFEHPIELTREELARLDGLTPIQRHSLFDFVQAMKDTDQ